MIEFQKLTLAQLPLLRRYLADCRSRLCDVAPGIPVMWRNTFDTDFAVVDGILFMRSRYNRERLAFTVPLGDYEKGVRLLSEHCRETGEPLCFCSVSEEDKQRLLCSFPDLTVTETRDWFDYLYERESLATLQGRKLAGQRNHRNFFLKNHPDWRFEVIGPDQIEEVLAFCREYYLANEKDDEYFRQEKEAVEEVLTHLEEYGFRGGLIRAEGEICAFALGEVLHDTLFVHVEKARRELRGSYQMIVSTFADHFGQEVTYVNREEDVGDLGLRYAKESYHPFALLKKYYLERG